MRARTNCCPPAPAAAPRPPRRLGRREAPTRSAAAARSSYLWPPSGAAASARHGAVARPHPSALTATCFSCAGRAPARMGARKRPGTAARRNVCRRAAVVDLVPARGLTTLLKFSTAVPTPHHHRACGEALRRREHRILVRRRINLDAQREGVGKARVLVGGRVGRRVRVAAPFKGGPQGAQSPVTIADHTKERSSKQNQSQYAAMRGWRRWRRERRWRR